MRILSTLLSLSLVPAVLASCGDGTGPGSRVIVTVTATRGPTVTENPEDGQRLSCEADLRATLEGSGSATWTDGWLRFYVGSDRDEPLDSARYTEDNVKRAWDGSELHENSAMVSRWRLEASVPFEVEFVFGFRRANGSAGQARARVPCGPEVSASSPLPTISRVAVVPPVGPLQAGDHLEVTYEAASAIGLWAVEASLTGPCLVRAERGGALQTTLIGSVVLQIPPGCGLNTPIAVNVTVVDAALRSVTRAAETTYRVVDLSPPYLATRFFDPWGGNAVSEIKGTFFLGERIEVDAIAEDNHSLASLGWEVEPAGHSATHWLGGTHAMQRLDLVTQPEWLGDIQLHLFATDMAGHTTRLATPPGALRVLPTTTIPYRTRQLTGELREFVIDERRGVAYLLQSNERRLAVLTLANMSLTTLDLPSYPTSLALSASGDSLILALPLLRALGIVDLRQATLSTHVHELTTLDASLGQEPRRVRVTSNGRAFIGLEGTSAPAYMLLELDLATGAERIRRDAGDNGFVAAANLEVSLDRSVMVMNGGPQRFQRYDAATDAFGTRTSVIPYDWPPMVDATGRWTLIGLQLFDTSLDFARRVESRIPEGANATPISVLSADGEHVLHALWPMGLIRSRTSDGDMIDRVPMPFQADVLGVSASGRWLVAIRGQYHAASEVAVLEFQ